MSHDSYEKNGFISDRENESIPAQELILLPQNGLTDSTHDSWDSESTQPYSVQQIFATEGGTEGLREEAIVAICYASK